MIVRYRYRAYPTGGQQQMLARAFGWCSTTRSGSGRTPVLLG
ncbi:helix-turn-helix domain-containing protein [Rhodococcus spelaei]|nr:helix-turn-helix domain-containing protein [Rhodococcus spelaei]